MNISVITANLGSFDPENIIVDQKLSDNFKLNICKLNDNNFPLRTKAMTHRLQARIPKMFGWQFVENSDCYIWLDGSFSIMNENTVNWYLEQLDNNDILFFKHPDRHSIKQEAEFLKQKIKQGNKYLINRYEGELIEEQLKACSKDKYDNDYVDDLLIATCSFIYRNKDNIKELLEKWWVHTSRYHIIDQLSISYLLKNSNCRYKILNDDIYHIPYLTYTRNKVRKD
jgi:hypothetical protein